MNFRAIDQMPYRQKFAERFIISNFERMIAARNMRIYEINTVARRDNAPGRIMLDIADAVTEAGDEAYISARDYGMSRGLHTVAHALRSRISDREGLFSVSSTFRLCRDIMQKRADIVHLHNIHGHYINYPLLFSFLRDYGRPVIWTLHDCWAFTGHCAYYTARECHNWEYGCRDCEATREYPVSYGRSRASENYNLKKSLFGTLPQLTIVCVSQWLAAEIHRSFLSGHRIEVIPNGIDTSIFSPDATIETSSRFRIIAVASNWKRNKGLETLNKIKSRLADDEEIAMISGIRDPRLLAAEYASSDVFINPSLEETFGMTTVEAMSCGLPVVVNNNTAQVETVNDRVGRVMDFRDIDGVIGCIRDIKHLGKPRFSASCRQHVLDNYRLQMMTDSYLSLFRDVTK